MAPVAAGGPSDLEEVAKLEKGDPGTPGCRVQMAHRTVKNYAGKHENEDRYMSEVDVFDRRAVTFHTVGVLDGHDGCTASDLASRMLPGLVGKRLKAGRKIVESYTQALAELEEMLKKKNSNAGTCVISCTVAGPYVWCANLGDCRAALFTLQALDGPGDVTRVTSVCWLSRDHKASTPEERQRIQDAGGQITGGRVEGLEPSRTLGDFDVKLRVREGVISIVPEVRRHEIGTGGSPTQAILVCATDGVWDVITGQDICDFIAARKDLSRAQRAIGSNTAPIRAPLQDLADDLVEFSIAKGSRDDCTATVTLISVDPHR